MLYYSNEARISAVTKIRELQEKILEIPENFLNHTDARQIYALLSILKSEIMKESKE